MDIVMYDFGIKLMNEKSILKFSQSFKANK